MSSGIPLCMILHLITWGLQHTWVEWQVDSGIHHDDYTHPPLIKASGSLFLETCMYPAET